MFKSIGVLLFVIQVCFAATIYVNPANFTDPNAIIAAMGAGDTLILADGTYKVTFDIPPGKDGFTIKSESGNPYNCIMDGQGGYPDHRLSYGKGIIHSRSPGNIIGIGFINGGGADKEADGEAGLYAESFEHVGTFNVVNCSFDGNENGIFVPGGSTGQNVDIVLNGCIFSKNKGNGVTTDGMAHNLYISCRSLTAIDNIHYPSMYGNNFKSRSPLIYIADKYNKHGPGRCLDIPSGGNLTIRGGVYTSVGPTATSNFFNYAGENTNSGVFTPDIDGMTIVGSRNNDAVWNAVSTITVNFKNTIQQWANTNPTFNFIGNIAGLVAAPPQGTVFVSIPEPVLPLWALPQGASTAAAATSTTASVASSTTAAAASTSTSAKAASTSTSAAAATTTTTAAAASSSTSSKGSTTTTASSTSTSTVTPAPSSAPTATTSKGASSSTAASTGASPSLTTTTGSDDVNSSSASSLVVCGAAIILIAFALL